MASYEHRPRAKSRPHRIRWSEGSGQTRRQRSRAFDTKTAALQFKAHLESKTSRTPTDRRTVEQATRDWVAEQWDHWSANRRQSVDGELRRHVVPIIGDVAVSKLERRHVEKVRDARRQGHADRVLLNPLNTDPPDYTFEEVKQFPAVGAASERKTLSIVATFTRWLVEDQQSLERDPSKGVKKSPLSNATKFGGSSKVTQADLPAPATIRDLVKQITDAGHAELSLLVEAVAFLGLRPQEAFALDVNDVVLDPAVTDQVYLSITKAIEEVPGRYTTSGRRRSIKNTKNYSSRDVPLSTEFEKKFKDHVASAKKRGGNDQGDTVALFARPDGGPITATWFRKKVLNPARRALGIAEDNTGRLRRAYAMLAVAYRGVPFRPPDRSEEGC